MQCVMEVRIMTPMSSHILDQHRLLIDIYPLSSKVESRGIVRDTDLDLRVEASIYPSTYSALTGNAHSKLCSSMESLPEPGSLGNTFTLPLYLHKAYPVQVELCQGVREGYMLINKQTRIATNLNNKTFQTLFKQNWILRFPHAQKIFPNLRTVKRDIQTK